MLAWLKSNICTWDKGEIRHVIQRVWLFNPARRMIKAKSKEVLLFKEAATHEWCTKDEDRPCVLSQKPSSLQDHVHLVRATKILSPVSTSHHFDTVRAQPFCWLLESPEHAYMNPGNECNHPCDIGLHRLLWSLDRVSLLFMRTKGSWSERVKVLLWALVMKL
jgi:hypothetical protein